MALMLAICSAQPNWIPRKPKLMFQICQKLRCGFAPPPTLIFETSWRLLDEQGLALVGIEGQLQLCARPQRAERLVVDEVSDRAAGRRGLDDYRLADGLATEVEGRDLGALAGGKPVNHDDQAPGLHRRDVHPL